MIVESNEYQYQTIHQEIENILYREKGSKFIGYVYPVRSEDEVKRKLNNIKQQHLKATHHCYAFRLGVHGENYRANDDGEPSGSAGLPIYNQLLASQLTYVLLIVVRYFGGTKLGIGGLVKAYRESAKITIAQADIINRKEECIVLLSFEFQYQNLIFSLLNKIDARIINFETKEKCFIEAYIEKSYQQKISEQLSEIYKVEFQFL